MIEIMISLTVLIIGALGYLRAIVSSNLLAQKTRETERATQAAREIMGRIDAEAFADAFRRFNSDPADDPGGAGTAPGAGFSVAGLSPLPGDPDGLVGEVIFPTAAAAPAQLRENVDLPELGMPRDLDGDLAVDAADHSLDYSILPVLVRVRWRSAAGPGSYELKTMLTNF